MNTIVISGSEISKKIKQKSSLTIQQLVDDKKRIPGIALVIAGCDKASEAYIKNAEKQCSNVGMLTKQYYIDKDATQTELANLIDDINNDPQIDGVLLQVPLPPQINADEIAARIRPDKDVDGFNVINSGKLYRGEKCFVPCTAKGIIRLLEEADIELQGKRVCIIGRSNIVGKPAAILALNKNATITICHSKTKNLTEVLKESDIVISAVGRPGIVSGDMVSEGCVIIDAGTTFVDGKLKGDVDYDSCIGKAKAITPVPGGVGAMTIAMLIENVLEAYSQHD